MADANAALQDANAALTVLEDLIVALVESGALEQGAAHSLTGRARPSIHNAQWMGHLNKRIREAAQRREQT